MFQEKFYYLFNNSECLDKRRDITRIVLFCELQPGMVANVIGCNRGVNISSGSNEKYNFRGSSLPTITVRECNKFKITVEIFVKKPSRYIVVVPYKRTCFPLSNFGHFRAISFVKGNQ